MLILLVFDSGAFRKESFEEEWNCRQIFGVFGTGIYPIELSNNTTYRILQEKDEGFVCSNADEMQKR